MSTTKNVSMNDHLLTAFFSPEVQKLGAELYDALQSSAEALTPGALIIHACRAAIQEDSTVQDLLVEHIKNVRSNTEVIEDLARFAKTLFAEIGAEYALAIRGVPANLFARQATLERLNRQIAEAQKTRDAAAGRYREAGLSSEQISMLGVEPTKEVEAAWRAKAEQIACEMECLSAFLKSPWNKSLLEGVELNPLPVAPDCPRGEPSTPAPLF